MGTDKRERQKASRQARLDEARAAQRRAANRQRVLVIGLIVVAVGAVVALTLLVGSDSDESATTAGTGDPATTTTLPAFAYGTGPCPPAEGVTEPVLQFPAAPQECIDPTRAYVATFDTSQGVVKVALDTGTTPGTANNFVVLADYGYYDGTELFRADQSIGIIQGGAPTNSPSDPGPGYTIPDEGGPYTYRPGQLVMARTAAPDSAGAQFFFTVTDAAANLDYDPATGQGGTYVVFGQVVEGMEVLEAVLALSDGQGDLGGAPSVPVVVNSVVIEELPEGVPAPTSVPVSTTPTTAAGEPVIVERGGTPTAPAP